MSAGRAPMMRRLRPAAAACTSLLASLAGFNVSAADAPAASALQAGVTELRDVYPDISPDGSRIAFQSNRSGTSQIWVARADGSGLTRLTRSGANDTAPVWSPDGEKIMFTSDRAGGASRDIFVLDVSGGLAVAERTATPVIESPADEMHPEWADSGRTIVFNRVYAAGDGSDVVIADADGGNEVIVPTPRGWNTYASLTPDGERLVWRVITEERRDGENIRNSDIYVAMRDGSRRVRLTRSPAFDGWPAVSPKGERIAFASNRGGGAFHLYLMALDGAPVRRLTNGSYDFKQPAWSPDGRALAASRSIEDELGEIGHIVLLNLRETGK